MQLFSLTSLPDFPLFWCVQFSISFPGVECCASFSLSSEELAALAKPILDDVHHKTRRHKCIGWKLFLFSSHSSKAADQLHRTNFVSIYNRYKQWKTNVFPQTPGIMHTRRHSCEESRPRFTVDLRYQKLLNTWTCPIHARKTINIVSLLRMLRGLWESDNFRDCFIIHREMGGKSCHSGDAAAPTKNILSRSPPTKA